MSPQLRKALRMTLLALSLFVLLTGVQVLIDYTTSPQSAGTNFQELITRKLSELKPYLSAASGAMLAIIGSIIHSSLIRRGTDQPADNKSSAAENKAHDTAQQAQLRLRLQQLQQEYTRVVSQLNTYAKISDAWAREVAALRETLTTSGRYRPMIVIAFWFAICHPLAAIGEVGINNILLKFGPIQPNLFTLYIQSYLLALGSLVITYFAVQRYQVVTQNASYFSAAAIGFTGIGLAGFVSLAMVTPAMYQAMSPSGWDVPLFERSIPLFFYLIFIRLVLLPVFGILGASLAFATTKRTPIVLSTTPANPASAVAPFPEVKPAVPAHADNS